MALPASEPAMSEREQNELITAQIDNANTTCNKLADEIARIRLELEKMVPDQMGLATFLSSMTAI